MIIIYKSHLNLNISRLVEELEPVGFGIATVHTEHEKDLARKIGAKELPHMVLLLDKKVIHYKDPQFSAVKAIEFVRRKFPYKLVEFIDDGNVDSFLSGWKDNRVRVLLFGHVSDTNFLFKVKVQNECHSRPTWFDSDI